MSNWQPENSIVDAEVAVMAKKDAISEFNIIEHETDVFYVTMRLHHWRDGILHLATRRVREEPRMFMNLGRLVNHIREKYGTITEIKLMLLPVVPITPKARLDRRRSNYGAPMPTEDEERRLRTLEEVVQKAAPSALSAIKKKAAAGKVVPKTPAKKPAAKGAGARK